MVKEKKDKVKTEVKETTTAVQQEATPAAVQQAVSFEHKVPLPWSMKYKSDINGGPIDKFIKELNGNVWLHVSCKWDKVSNRKRVIYDMLKE